MENCTAHRFQGMLINKVREKLDIENIDVYGLCTISDEKIRRIVENIQNNKSEFAVKKVCEKKVLMPTAVIS